MCKKGFVYISSSFVNSSVFALMAFGLMNDASEESFLGISNDWNLKWPTFMVCFSFMMLSYLSNSFQDQEQDLISGSGSTIGSQHLVNTNSTYGGHVQKSIICKLRCYQLGRKILYYSTYLLYTSFKLQSSIVVLKQLFSFNQIFHRVIPWSFAVVALPAFAFEKKMFLDGLDYLCQPNIDPKKISLLFFSFVTAIGTGLMNLYFSSDLYTIVFDGPMCSIYQLDNQAMKCWFFRSFNYLTFLCSVGIDAVIFCQTKDFIKEFKEMLGHLYARDNISSKLLFLFFLYESFSSWVGYGLSFCQALEEIADLSDLSKKAIGLVLSTLATFFYMCSYGNYYLKTGARVAEHFCQSDRQSRRSYRSLT